MKKDYVLHLSKADASAVAGRLTDHDLAGVTVSVLESRDHLLIALDGIDLDDHEQPLRDMGVGVRLARTQPVSGDEETNRVLEVLREAGADVTDVTETDNPLTTMKERGECRKRVRRAEGEGHGEDESTSRPNLPDRQKAIDAAVHDAVAQATGEVERGFPQICDRGCTPSWDLHIGQAAVEAVGQSGGFSVAGATLGAGIDWSSILYQARVPWTLDVLCTTAPSGADSTTVPPESGQLMSPCQSHTIRGSASGDHEQISRVSPRTCELHVPRHAAADNAAAQITTDLKALPRCGIGCREVRQSVVIRETSTRQTKAVPFLPSAPVESALAAAGNQQLWVTTCTVTLAWEISRVCQGS